MATTRANITTTLTIKNEITGKNYSLNNFYTEFQRVRGVEPGILKYVMNTLPGARPDDIQKGKTIQILRMKRDYFEFKTDYPDSSNSGSVFQPAAKEVLTTTLGEASPEGSYNTKIIDITDEVLLRRYVQNAVVDYFEALTKLFRKKAITLLKADAAAYTLFANDDEKTRTSQGSVNSTKTIANLVSDINAGKRISLELAPADWDSSDNRVKALRAAIKYFREIGTPNSKEKGYPFAQAGYRLENLVILCKAAARHKLTASNLTQLVNPQTGINQNYASLDGVEIAEENMLDDDIEYIVMTRDALFKVENPITTEAALGTITKPESLVVDIAGTPTSKNLRPSQGALKFNFNAYMGTFTPGACFILKSS